MSTPVLYFLIAYKPNSDDYCRGCHMASYSSNFESHANLTQPKLVEELAKLLFYNYYTQTGESGYSYQILRDGVLVHDSIEDKPATYLDHYYDITPDGDVSTEGVNEAEFLSGLIHNEMNATFIQAQLISDEKIKLEHEQALAAAEKKKVAQAAKDLADKRALLEKLQRELS